MTGSDIKVDLINSMGNDLSVVNAARVSFDKWSETLSPKDIRLIGYLAKHKHLSPFNHTFLSFRVKAPLFVARQLVKHEYMPWNEVSRRYVDSAPEFYFPKALRSAAKDKKQGSGGEHPDEWAYRELGMEHTLALQYFYEEMIEEGVCAEQARMYLPQNMMTTWIWSGTLGAFANMLKLRLPNDTQQESQEVAELILPYIKERFPYSIAALLEN